MRMLLPEPIADLDDAALDDAYAWPGRPWLRANMVATADGSARGSDGLSGGISSPADKRVFGRLRGLADAVMVGAGTVRAEGYRAARGGGAFAERRAAAGQRGAPVIAVVTRSLALDPSSPLFAEPVERPVVLTAAAADAGRRAALRRVADVVDCGEVDVDLGTAVGELHGRGLTRILTEGGPHLLGDLVTDSLLDELCLTVSPLLAGGEVPAGDAGARIISGARLPAPSRLRLGHVLEEDGVLFLRYLLGGAS